MNKERLLEGLRVREGYRQLPYRDHLGHWTVGVGHLLEDEPIRMHPSEPIGALLDWITDPDQHDRWLMQDVTDAIAGATRFVGLPVFDSLSDRRQEVLAEMVFQMGEGGLAKFVKFKAAILAEDWAKAAHEMQDSLWARQTPGRARRLANYFDAG